ncbi:MAG: hypothetical protein ACI38V_10530 [Bacteroides sp.]
MEKCAMFLSIQKVISQFGVEIIQSKKFLFLLDDFSAFSDEPKPVRKILKDMIDLGYVVELYKIGEWNTQCNVLSQRFIDTTGFREDYTKHVFEALAKGFRWNVLTRKEENNNKFNNLKSLSHFSVNRAVPSSRKNYEQNYLDYISRNAVNTSNFEHIKCLNISIKGVYPQNELTISFVFPELSPYRKYAFYYCLINSFGTILEKDTISLMPSSKTLRCIDSVGCGILLTDIAKIEYGIIFDGMVDQNIQPHSKPKDLSRNLLHRNITDQDEQNHLDYISKNAVNTSKLDCIRNIHVLSKGKYPQNELRISFLLSKLSPYDHYTFYYSLIDSFGSVLEKDAVSLMPSSKTLRCIDSVGCGILLTDIAKIEYGIIFDGIVDQNIRPHSKSIDSSGNGLHRSITDQDLTKLSVWRSDLDSFGRNRSIYLFHVHKAYDYLEFRFKIKSFNKNTKYKFCYVIKDKNSHIMEEDCVKLEPNGVDSKIVTECAYRLDHSKIITIEYYLKRYNF